MAAPSNPASSSRLNHWQAQLFLNIARLVQRTIAHRRYRLEVRVRNWAMKAANHRGIDKATITKTIGLSGQQVGTILDGKQPRKRKPAEPAIEGPNEADHQDTA